MEKGLLLDLGWAVISANRAAAACLSSSRFWKTRISGMDIGQRNFCRAGQRAGIERIHAALQILPFAPIPLNESVSLGRTPRACFVKGETFLAIFLPAVEQRGEHFPGKINKIVAGEKHGVAQHAIEQ